jgi:8-oxo-dGTP pyrophosphatase MutT (NUDIX family)
VLIAQEGPFVPQATRARLDEVDRRWEALRAANPAYFDGRLCHVLGVHRNGHGGASLHVVDCAYRFHAVQDQDFDLGVRPLGVKGLTMRKGHVLVGRRSPHVNAYRGLWEFAPGGVVEPGHDPAQTVRMELREEAGLELGAEPNAIALMFDAVLWSWELIYRLVPGAGEPVPRRSEYTELDWFDPERLPVPLSPLAQQMVPLLGSE